VILVLTWLATAVSAQDAAVSRVSLPLDGTAFDIAPYASTGVAEVRIVVSGTVSSSIDGSEIDAMTRRVGTVQLDNEAPYLTLPRGSRLEHADRATHTYTFAIPRDRIMPVVFNPRALASSHLVVFSEAVNSLSGAIFVEVTTPPEPFPVASLAQHAPNGPYLPFGALLGLLLGIPATGGAGLLIRSLWKRRRTSEDELLKRARRAFRSIEDEVARLGPAFDDASVMSARVLEAAGATRQHLRELDGALHRTRWARAHSAQQRREEILNERHQAVDRLRVLAERLEETATRLAGHAAQQSRTSSIDEALSALSGELETAVEADLEAAR